nr:hypothetical protein [bacterium]
QSAAKRGEMFLKYNDYSYDASQSGYTMEKAMREVGYRNIVWGEAPTPGYFEAEELLENQFAFPQSKSFLLNPEYQDIGIAEVQGEVNGCPAHLIVQQMAGYVPPNYKPNELQAWRELLSSLREVEVGWSSLTESGEYYQSRKSDIDRINEIISLRLSSTATILSKMEANQWLSAADENLIENDKALASEQQELARKLNSQ